MKRPDLEEWEQEYEEGDFDMIEPEDIEETLKPYERIARAQEG